MAVERWLYKVGGHYRKLKSFDESSFRINSNPYFHSVNQSTITNKSIPALSKEEKEYFEFLQVIVDTDDKLKTEVKPFTNPESPKKQETKRNYYAIDEQKLNVCIIYSDLLGALFSVNF